MNEHEEIRNLLSLAAAGVLEEAEEQRVAAHVARCPECAAELEGWQALAGGLRRLPTPQAPAALMERVRARATAELAEQLEERPNLVAMLFLVLVSWTVTLATWPLVRLAIEGMFGWLNLELTWLGLVGYTLLGWLTAGVAAGLLGWHARAARRFV